MTNPFQSHNGTIPTQPSCFADAILQLFGDDFDPDPLFLEESWTLGIPIAAENLHSRRQNTIDRERQSRAFRELSNLGSLFLIEGSEGAAGSLLADRANMIANKYASTWSQRTAPISAPPTRDQQQRWIPADLPSNDQILQGSVPEGGPRQNAVLREAESFAEPRDTIAVGRAHRLLGTRSTNTHEQIRSAYRRKVSEWHPDRLQYASEAIREHATQQMAAINQAYRLLRTALLQDAA